MADFCRQCAKDADPNFPGDDLAGLCKEGEFASALCEGCGWTWVDNKGRCVGPVVHGRTCPAPSGGRRCINFRHKEKDKEWWTAHEVADLFRVHITTVYRWVSIGKLPATRISRNLYRIKAADVRKLEAMELEQQGHLRMGEGE